jgi:phenylalanyl-tRNA synthetase beta chain
MGGLTGPEGTMKIGYEWLREFVAFEMSVEELAESLTMLGFPVSWIGPSESEYPGILTGQVREVRKHPRADKLVVCDVSIGEQSLRIVCGAPNVRPGMKVAVATVGAVLPDGVEIKKVSIRGETSEGMLCSGAELGLSEDAAGILELPESARAGVDLDEHLGVAETVLELEVSHNRSDCLSVYGLARELAAFLSTEAKFPAIAEKGPESPSEKEGHFEVRIDDAGDCPRYCGQLLTGIKVGPSPSWLRRRLQIAGFRALNNVVDSTNYCLASFGQPIHAFDFDRVKRRSILVRRARRGETLVTLDGNGRILNPEVLLITDGERPIALAGVMGGEDTEVKQESSRLLLESAHFSPEVIKRGSKTLGLESEASLRFSRGTDPEIAAACVKYVSRLISSLSGGRRSSELVDCYPGKRAPKRIVVSPRRIRRILGDAVSDEFVEESLVHLGFGWERKKEEVEVTVPSFRYDMSEEVDVVEEVARTFGYDRFDERAANLSWVPGVDEEREAFLETCRAYMVSAGLIEAFTKVLVDPGRMVHFLGESDVKEAVGLENPTSSAEAVLRPSVLPGLLDAVRVNLRRGVEDVRFFEIGKVFRDVRGVAEERFAIAAAMCGRKSPPSWQSKDSSECDTFDVKGVLEGLLGNLKVDSHKVLCYDGVVLEREASGSICCNDNTLGVFGLVNQKVLRAFEVERDVYVFEVDADMLRQVSCERPRFSEPSRYPPAKRDIAVIADATLPQAEVAELIDEFAGEHLRSLELFDVYTGDPIPEGKKSLAYSLSFQSAHRTLSDEDVESMMERILQGLKTHGLEVRGS